MMDPKPENTVEMSATETAGFRFDTIVDVVVSRRR